MRSPSITPALSGLTAALLAAATFAPAALAQDDSTELGEVRPGTKVRVTAPKVAPDRLTRVVAEVRPDTIVLAPDRIGAGYLVLPLDQVSRLEVSRGKPGRTASTGIGALAGFVGGLAIGLNLNESGPCTEGFACLNNLGTEVMETTFVTMGVALGGALVGGVVGYALGSIIFQDSWRDVSSDAVRVSIAPHRRGAAVAVTVAF